MSADGGAAFPGLKARIQRYFGGRGHILAIRRTLGGSAFHFVIDAMERGRLIRTLGTLGRNGGALMEQSAMDLGQPERLVFAYERGMLVSLALAATPARLLLLGLGGGAMCRHLDAYVPDAALNIVEHNPDVVALARQYFHFRRDVVAADARAAVARARGTYDVVMVDLYDASGGTILDEKFWRDCRAALAPGGAIAINWPGSLEGNAPRAEIARAMAALKGSFLLIENGSRPNIIQLMPTLPDFQPSDLATRLRAFGRSRKLPREDRAVLQRATVAAKLPAGRRRD